MKFKPLNPPYWGKAVSQAAFRWLAHLVDVVPYTQTFQQSLDVASVPANSESVQTFSVAGLTTDDIVMVNKPSSTAGLDLVQAWVSAKDTLSLKFRNATGSAIDPGSETYLIVTIRR